MLSLLIRGAGAPTLSPRDLRELSIPVPDDVVVRLISDLHDVEQKLVDRIDTARGIRQRLFSIDDPEQVDSQLHALNVEAQVLAGSDCGSREGRGFEPRRSPSYIPHR